MVAVQRGPKEEVGARGAQNSGLAVNRARTVRGSMRANASTPRRVEGIKAKEWATAMAEVVVAVLIVGEATRAVAQGGERTMTAAMAAWVAAAQGTVVIVTATIAVDSAKPAMVTGAAAGAVP